MLDRYQLSEPHSSGGVSPNVDDASVKEGVSLHHRISERIERSGGYRTFAIKGIAQPTNQSARLSLGRIETLREHKGKYYTGGGTAPRPSSHPPEWETDASCVMSALVRSDVTMKVIEERWADDIAERIRVSKRVISLCRMHENYSEFLPCKWAEEIVFERQTGFRGAFMGPESSSDGTSLLDNVPNDIMTEWYNGIVLPVRRRDASAQFSEDLRLMKLLNGSDFEKCSCLFSL